MDLQIQRTKTPISHIIESERRNREIEPKRHGGKLVMETSWWH